MERRPEAEPPGTGGAAPPERTGTSPLGHLLRHGGVYALATALQLGSALLIAPLLTRVLAPEAYGAVSTFQVVLQLLAMVVALGLPAAVLRQFYEDGDDAARRLATAGIASALALTALATATAPLWLGLTTEDDLGPALLLAVLGAAPTGALLCSQPLLQARKRPGRYVAVSTIISPGAQVAGTIGAIAADGSPTGYFAGALAAYVLALAVNVALARPLTWPPPSSRALGHALRIGLPTVPHSLSLYLLAFGDRFVVASIDGLDAAGRYQVAYLVGALGITILLALNQAWAPIVLGEPSPGRWTVLRETTAELHGLVALVVAGLALGAPIALRILAPSTYEVADLTTVSVTVAIAAVPYVTYLSAVHVLFSTGRTRSLAWITPAIAALNLGANAAVVPLAGLWGAAAVTLVSYALQAVLVRRAAGAVAEVAWDRGAHARAWAVALGVGALGAALPADGPALVARTAAAVVLAALAALRALRLART